MVALSWDTKTGRSNNPTHVTEPHTRSEKINRSRASVLSYLVKLNKCINANHGDLCQALIQRFTEALIDYVSLSHFRWFDTPGVPQTQRAALNNITDRIIEFNDRYVHREKLDLMQLKHDLEEIALALEVRFEIEDEIRLRSRTIPTGGPNGGYGAPQLVH